MTWVRGGVLPRCARPVVRDSRIAMWRAFVVAVLACAALFAERAEAQARGPVVQSRRIGIGSVLGGGFSYNVIPTLVPPTIALGPQADFGTLEVRVFLPRDHGSIDLYSQLGNTILSGALALAPRAPSDDGSLVFASLGALYDFDRPFADPRWRAILAFGLEVGGDYGVGGRFDRTHPTKIALRIPARIGVERLFPERAFGLLFVLRPFFEVVGYARNEAGSVVSPGVAVLAEVGFVFYPR